MLAARAGYLAGFSGSATVEAGLALWVPVYGTMAHSYVQAHDEEVAAFERFAHAQPYNVVLLLDTYDTEAALRKWWPWRRASANRASRSRGCASIAATWPTSPAKYGASTTRWIQDVRILASGNLDEEAVRTMVLRRADR